MAEYASQVLVETAWLAERLDYPTLRIVEVDEDTTAYEKGHIPGGCPADRGTWWRPPEGSYGQAVTARADSGVSAVARRSASASWGSCLKPLMRRN